LAALVALLCGGLAYFYAASRPKTYEASVTLIVVEPQANGPGGFGRPSSIDPSVYVTALRESDIVYGALAKVLGRAPSEAEQQRLLDRMHVAIDKEDRSSLLTISVSDRDPAAAAAIANALSETLIAWDRDRAQHAIAAGVVALQQSIDTIDAELKAGDSGQPLSDQRRNGLITLRADRVRQLTAARIAVQAALVSGSIEPIQSASPPNSPSGPGVAFTVMLAVLFGLFLGYGFAYFRQSLDPLVRSGTDLGAVSGLPVLAEFLAARRRSPTGANEAASFLRTGLLQHTGPDEAAIFAIAGADAGVGANTVAVGLAVSLARSGYRTLLVDADLRRSSNTYGLDVASVESPPLEVYLENPERDYRPQRIEVGQGCGFDFVPSYTSAAYPVELLNKGFGGLLAGWRGQYQAIVVDCPPVLPFADTLAIAPLCTGLVLCARSAQTTRQAVAEGIERLRHIDTRLLGAVLTESHAWPTQRKAVGGGAEVQPRPHIDPYRTLTSEGRMTNVTIKER
jgi:Mrp family chromosome partitioning ATPase